MESQIRLTNALIGQRVLEISRRRLRFAPAAGDGAAVVAGDTAYVTRLHHQDGRYVALRVARDRSFGGEWARHYAALARDLPEDVRSYVPTDITPIEGGITIAGTKLPAVLMEWLDGFTVYEAAAHAAMEGNRGVLLALSDALLELYGALRDARVTHGDLSPENLMMRSTGDIVCVDLDTVQWPGMRVRSLQAGSAAYRHPRRGAIPRHQDAFAVLVIMTSLHVLADVPECRHDVDVSGGGLVFSPWDLADPSSSRIFDLAEKRAADPTKTLLSLLRRAVSSEPYQTPELLAEAMALPRATETEDPEDTATPDAPDDREWDLGQVIERLRSEFGEGGIARDTRFETTWPRAEQDAAGSVVADPPGPEARVVADDDVSTLEREDEMTTRFRERIAEAARKQDDEAIVRLARSAEDRHLPLGEETRRIVRLARERAGIRARLERALEADDKSALANLAQTGELVVLGDTDRASLTRVLRALEWPGLARALDSDDDALILTWYDDDLFGDTHAVPDDLRKRIDLAHVRTRWVNDIREILKRRDVRALESMLADEPEGGLDQLSRGERARVLRMIERQSALDSLHTALRGGDSPGILKALNAIEQSGARIENPATWAAVQSVLERATLLEQIIDAASGNPPDDRQLAHLLPVAKRMGLQHDPSLTRHFAFTDLEEMVLRGAALRRIRRAIDRDDDQAIRQAAYPDVTGALSLLREDERARVEDARARRIVARSGAGR